MRLIATLLLLLTTHVSAESPLRYSVLPAPVDAKGISGSVRVTITLPDAAARSRFTLIMPRAIPMGYGQQLYDQFVTVTARSRSGASALIKREEGPRWTISTTPDTDPVTVIEAEVDLVAMEDAILSGGDSSRAREGFLGLLGYSVFPYVDGLETRAIDLRVSPPANAPDWPVFSTLAPRAPTTPGAGGLEAQAPDFYHLADSQILMGPRFRVKKIGSAPDLFLAVHAEGPADLNLMEPLARQAFDALAGYFGSTPFPHFTLIFEYLKPRSPRHTYGFSMEHMQSATFGALASAGLTPMSGEREKAAFRYNVAHHVSHAWIPKRCAGEGYFPFRWELAPLLDTIWLSEGFGQYAAADALSDVLPKSVDGKTYRETLVDFRFRNTLRDMPDFLKAMPLVELSRTASTLYSEDFRTGRTVFARGGLMANEMDEKIRAASGGKARLRDALRALVAWSAREKRPFRIEELPGLFERATGVDTREVMERWLAGMK